MSKIKASTTSTTAYQVEADTTGTLVFQTGATPTTAVTIDGSQNVGIGESTPASTLVVRKDSTGARGGELSIVNAGTTANTSAALNFGVDTSTYSGDNSNAQIKAVLTNSSTSATDLVFSVYNGTTFLESVRINSTGSATIPKGVSGTPAFRAYQSGSQSLSDTTDTKVTLNNEGFDTASCFNNTGSTVGGIPAYSFLPNVAGYYQINGRIGLDPVTSNWGFCSIWKNGVMVARGSASNSTSFTGSTVSDVVYLNGTTDYVALYMIISGGSTTTEAGGAFMTYFSGALVRAA